MLRIDRDVKGRCSPRVYDPTVAQWHRDVFDLTEHREPGGIHRVRVFEVFSGALVTFTILIYFLEALRFYRFIH